MPLASPQKFLRKPEAVLPIIALAVLSSLSQLSNAASQITRAITLRARHIAHTTNLQRRLKDKLREREFLQSAVDATVVTLDDTKEYLRRQVKRANNAESMLQRLVEGKEKIDAIIGRGEQMRLQLVEAESQLGKERLRAKRDEKVIQTLENDIFTRQQELDAFENDVTEAKQALEEIENAERGVLDRIVQERDRLELILQQKTAQLKEEVAARDLCQKAYSNAEHELEETNTAFDDTVLKIEEQRQVIEQTSKEAKKVASVAERKRATLEAVRREEINVTDLEMNVHVLQGEREGTRTLIQALIEKQNAKDTERNLLVREIVARDAKLLELRSKLEELKVAPSVIVNNDATDVAIRKPLRGNSEAQDDDLDEEPVGNIWEEKLGIRDVEDHNAVSERKLTEEPQPAQPPAPQPKRRRGRPRKTETETKVDGIDEKPKRKPGRPRKAVSATKADPACRPKRKRGRPRKTSIPTSS